MWLDELELLYNEVGRGVWGEGVVRGRPTGGGGRTRRPSLRRGDAGWQDDRSAAACPLCRAKGLVTRFGLFQRRHHCRRCGILACAACSGSRRVLVAQCAPERVCYRCDAELALLERTPPVRPQEGGPEPSPPWQL